MFYSKIIGQSSGRSHQSASVHDQHPTNGKINSRITT